jgi:hypothetical protein
MKWCPKHDCIMTQSTAPGRLISVARKTMSSPAKIKSKIRNEIKRKENGGTRLAMS